MRDGGDRVASQRRSVVIKYFYRTIVSRKKLIKFREKTSGQNSFFNFVFIMRKRNDSHPNLDGRSFETKRTNGAVESKFFFSVDTWIFIFAFVRTGNNGILSV
jgi:hypothetical protein